MPYCIYLRKSRADAEAELLGEGETLPATKNSACLGKKLKLPITKIYKEILSGETIAGRPVMQQLIQDGSRHLAGRSCHGGGASRSWQYSGSGHYF